MKSYGAWLYALAFLLLFFVLLRCLLPALLFYFLASHKLSREASSGTRVPTQRISACTFARVRGETPFLPARRPSLVAIYCFLTGTEGIFSKGRLVRLPLVWV